MRLDPVLMCAVCGGPVERVTAFDGPSALTRTFVAYCHGESDVCTLGLDAMRDLSDAVRRREPVSAVAFGGRATRNLRPALPEGAPAATPES